MEGEELPSRYLIVANQTLGGDALVEIVIARDRLGPATFHIVVPATPTVDDVLGAGALYGGVVGAEGLAVPADVDDESTSHERARRRLAAAFDRFHALGINASGEVGDPDPIIAIERALERHDADEIIVSTLPPGISRWLRLDLVQRVRRRFDLPVTHVYAEEPASA